MKATCPHCQVEIEIDPATHAALAGHSHFACPACQGAVPVPAPVKLQQHPLPGRDFKVPVGKPRKARSHPAALITTNRALLILGTAALIVIGGIVCILATQKAGESHTTTTNIHSNFIENTFFRNLISSGQTTARDLEAIESAVPLDDGFIGVSTAMLTWSEAQTLAAKTASSMLVVNVPGDKVPDDLDRIIRMHFPELTGTTSWISRRNSPGLVDSPDMTGASTLETRRRALFQWPRTGENRHPDASPETDFEYRRGISSVEITRYSGGGGDIVVPNMIGGLPVTAIGERAFENNQSITGVFIPSSVAHIGGWAFHRCSNITKLTLSEGLKFIGDSAFRGCRGLVSLTIPGSVDLIRWNGFQACVGLETLTFVDGIKILENSSFQGCISLKSITIPPSVSHIGWNAFRDCTSLRSLVFQGDAPALGGDAFTNTSSGFEIRCRAGALGFTFPKWHGWTIQATE